MVEEVDQFALRSQHCAAAAIQNNYFDKSIIPVYDDNRCIILDHDEHPRSDTSLAKLKALKPSFAALGKIGFDEVAIVDILE